jgi:hypothetical protein
VTAFTANSIARAYYYAGAGLTITR